jgi:MYXO-CTERM domain-containing protein
MDGQVFAEDPAAMTIEINASDVGWGVKEVRLEIDGNDIGVSDDVPPYAFGGASFPAGSYYLVATAEDFAGHISYSDPVGIGVGGQSPPDDPPPSNDESGTGDGSDTGSGEVGTGTGTGPGFDAGDDGGDSGCACSTRDEGSSWPALALFGLLGLARRRRL